MMAKYGLIFRDQRTNKPEGIAGADWGFPPLCLGLFGPPGPGKTFSVKTIAASALGGRKEYELIEINMSQENDFERAKK